MGALLRDAGLEVVDYGDRPIVRWEPRPSSDPAHDLARVLDVLGDARRQIAGILEDGHRPLVIGGECTLAIALLSAIVEAGEDVALIYFDGGQDLLNTKDNPEEGGSLDAMGVAHMLDLPDAVPDLAGFGPRRPLLRPEQVCFFGFGEVDDASAALTSPRFDADDVARDPQATAQAALEIAISVARRYVIHFDVDVIDFFDLPAADVPQHGTGLRLADATIALSVLVGHPGFAGMTFTEFNPDHGSPDGSTARTLAVALAGALQSMISR